MSESKKPRLKLRLSKETVRALTTPELEAIAGGVRTGTVTCVCASVKEDEDTICIN